MKYFQATEPELLAREPYFRDVADAQIQAEPQWFCASVEHILTEAPDSIVAAWIKFYNIHYTAIIDTRVHMLKPEWLPCIGGWHLDDCPRADGQPDIWQASDDVEHWILNTGSARSNTEFVMPKSMAIAMPDEFSEDRNVYAQVHDAVEVAHAHGALNRWLMQNGETVKITGKTLHRGTPSENSGWRLFARASCGTVRTALNERRTQTQVYLPSQSTGW